MADFKQLVDEWDPILNGDLRPEDVKAGSTRKIHWLCVKGHRWFVSATSRASHTTSCPYCTNRKVSYENSVMALYPDIAAELHPTKNKLGADEITPGSFRTMIWRCLANPAHPDWPMRVFQRTHQGQGCPEHGRERVRSWQKERQDAKRSARFGAPEPSSPPETPPDEPLPEPPRSLISPEELAEDGFPF